MLLLALRYQAALFSATLPRYIYLRLFVREIFYLACRGSGLVDFD